MIRNCFADAVGGKGRVRADHDVHDNDRGLYRGRITLMDHVGGGRMKDAEHSDRLAVETVGDVVDDCRSWLRTGFVAMMAPSGLLRPLLPSRS